MDEDSEIPIEMVKRLLKQMEAKALPDDKPAQAMIRKYKRLLAQELRNQRGKK